MKRILAIIFSIFVISIIVFANENFDEAVRLIESKVPCSELTDNQLEAIGDYYMEQIHPGELHEIMDNRMGGEGSESLRLVHINLARNFYCSEYGAMPIGMMDMMMNRGGNNMMGYYGSPYGWWGFGWFGMIIMILFWAVIIWLIVWAVKQFTTGKESPLDLLEKRFAKGEISKKEYSEMKREMRK